MALTVRPLLVLLLLLNGLVRSHDQNTGTDWTSFPSTTTTTTPPAHNDMTLELAIGIPLGVVALLIIISVIVYFSCRRKKVIPEEEILKMEFEKNFEEQVYSKSTSIALQHRDRNRYEDILPYQDDDFWQLIWEQRVQIIVRLSTDNSSQTVARYIDDRGDNTWVMGHDELNVSVLTTHNNGVFYKRTFKVSKDNDVRFIEHFHMTNWPEGRVPQRDDTLNLIVSARSASIKYGSESPTLIHCGCSTISVGLVDSAGCGRTGTIIALWHMIDEFLADRMVNIVRTVESMRRCRMSMVKSVIRTAQMATHYGIAALPLVSFNS
ncbi:Receptor-type tyrosine-protein phosphatase O-like [Homarus americanus]|uniref:Receptor-type tyrosine-protein phosphatase O-like n=1 Tax=Homarus americanus TaxID=6706 RepID=A0A8J5JIF0_HOMAM|nr:Receptor-type tyrosine-protein phosphatase O-like [Homarus americanus]